MYFLGVDGAQAFEKAYAMAARTGTVMMMPGDVQAEALWAVMSTDRNVVPMIDYDSLAPRQRVLHARLVREGRVMAHGTEAYRELEGCPLWICGTLPTLASYKTLRTEATDAAAAQQTENFSGDVSAARAHFDLLAQRARVIRCVDAIRAQDLKMLVEQCNAAVAADVDVVLRNLVTEYRSGSLLSWSEQEAGPLLDHIDFIEATLPTSSPKYAQAAFYAIMFGVFYAHAERGL